MRDGCAERLVPTAHGTAIFTESLSRVWTLNVLRIDRTAAAALELAAEAERLQGEAALTHRRVLVTDEGTGRALEDGFIELGWKTDAFLFMAHRRNPAHAIDTSIVVEVEREALVPLREQIVWETLPDADEETATQISEANRRFAELGRARHFAVPVAGEPVSAADVYSDGRTAQIEDVSTLGEHRGRGYASAVVMRALEEARQDHDFVFLTADSRDWPKELYRRLGFDSLGEKYAFLLSGASAAQRRSTAAS